MNSMVELGGNKILQIGHSRCVFKLCIGSCVGGGSGTDGGGYGPGTKYGLTGEGVASGLLGTKTQGWMHGLCIVS